MTSSISDALRPVGWWPEPAFWHTVARLTGWGPLIGGAPYNLFVLPIPFSYALGLGPALLGGIAYALWLHAPTRRAPRAVERMLFGGLCAAGGCALGAMLLPGLFGSSPIQAFPWLALHGVPAGVVLALTRAGRAEAEA